MNDELKAEVIRMYFEEQRSSGEIGEYLRTQKKYYVTDRTIQRWIKAEGKPRSQYDSYQIAMSKGRVAGRIPVSVQFARKIQDNYTCQNCGVNRHKYLRVVQIVEGYPSQENVITLCIRCIKPPL